MKIAVHLVAGHIVPLVQTRQVEFRVGVEAMIGASEETTERRRHTGY